MTEHEQFASSIATPMLRPGERVLAIGLMYYDLPVLARVLLVFITMWIRAAMMKHYFAVATNQRLILIQTSQTWFTPKMLNKGVETIEYADIASIQPGFEPAAKKLIIKTKNGASRPLFMLGSCKVLPAQGQLNASFRSWAEAAAAAGGVVPGTDGGASPSMPGASAGAAMPGMGAAAGTAIPHFAPAPPQRTLAERLAPFNLFFFAGVLVVFSLFSGCTTAGCLKGASRKYETVEHHERMIAKYKAERAAASKANDVDDFAEAKKNLKRHEEWLDEYQMKAVKDLGGGAGFGLLSLLLLAGAGGLGFVWSKKHKVEMAKQKEADAEKAKTAATGSAFAGAAAMNAQPGAASGPMSGQAFSGAGPMSGQAFSAPASMPQPPAAHPSPPSAQGAFAQPLSSASYGQPAPSQPSAFAPGARVNVTWPNGQRYAATVVQSAPDKVLCEFEGGQQQWVDAKSVSA